MAIIKSGKKQNFSAGGMEGWGQIGRHFYFKYSEARIHV